MRKITVWQGLCLLLPGGVIAEAAEDPVPVVLKQQNGAACMTVQVSEAQRHLCTYRDPLNPKKCYPYSKVALSDCLTSGSRQQWYYDNQNNILHSTDYSSAMCLTRTVDTLEMIPCVTGSSAQMWRFKPDDVLESALDRSVGRSYLPLISGGTYEQLPIVRELFERSGRGESDPPPDPDEDSGSELSWEDVPEDSHWVSQKVTGDLRLRVDGADSCLGLIMPDNCETGRSCFARAKVRLRQCGYSEDEIWRHDLRSKHLFVKRAGYRFCLTWLHGKLTMFGCFAGGVPAQKWYFARGRTPASSERGLLRSENKGINEPYEYIQSLNRPLELNPRRRVRVRVELVPGRASDRTGCGYNPVTGDELLDC